MVLKYDHTIFSTSRKCHFVIFFSVWMKTFSMHYIYCTGNDNDISKFYFIRFIRWDVNRRSNRTCFK